MIATIQSAAHTVSGGMLGPSCMAAGRGEIGRVHIVLAGNADQGEEGIAARDERSCALSNRSSTSVSSATRRTTALEPACSSNIGSDNSPEDRYN